MKMVLNALISGTHTTNSSCNRAKAKTLSVLSLGDNQEKDFVLFTQFVIIVLVLIKKKAVFTFFQSNPSDT